MTVLKSGLVCAPGAEAAAVRGSLRWGEALAPGSERLLADVIVCELNSGFSFGKQKVPQVLLFEVFFL